MKYSALLLLLTVFFFASCKDQTEQDEELILQYIADNNLDAIAGSEGLYYVIDSVGAGAQPVLADEVKVDYEGFLLDGTKFDSSIDRGEAATFPLQGVIRGWQIGIPYFREGGGGKLLIPSELGYGKNGTGSIPKNAVLVFNVDLIEVNP